MAEAAREEYGGYSGFTFVDKVSEAQNCPICLWPMRDTVQTACGHRFCRSCLLQTFSQNNKRLCPQCRTPIPSIDKLFLDLAWQRDIDSLRVKCKRWKKGCDWIGAVVHHMEHFRVCNYREVTCNDCHSKMQKRHLNTHQTTDCPFRTVQCEHCEEDIIANLKEMHQYEQCRNFRDKQEAVCKNREKERCMRYQTDFLKTINLMYTKTSKAVASLHTAANYLDETWETYNQARSGIHWGKFAVCAGGIAAIAAGHPVIGGVCCAAGLLAGMTGDVWSPELEKAEKHFMAAESAVKEMRDTILLWETSPTLAKKLRTIHEDMLQKAKNVPITPKQAGLNAVWQVTAAAFGQNVRYSIQDIVNNWAGGAAKILREKAEELNELTLTLKVCLHLLFSFL